MEEDLHLVNDKLWSILVLLSIGANAYRLGVFKFWRELF